MYTRMKLMGWTHNANLTKYCKRGKGLGLKETGKEREESMNLRFFFYQHT